MPRPRTASKRSHVKIKRYGIYWADLDPTRGSEIAKLRPVVVISPEAMNRYLETVVACPLTSQLHPAWRSRIQVTCGGKPAEIAVDQIRTLSKARLTRKLDQLGDESAVQLRQLIAELYGS